MIYRFTFKCRLCGKKFTQGVTGSQSVATKAIIEYMVQKPTSIFENAVHICRDGSIGIGDLLGAKGYKE